MQCGDTATFKKMAFRVVRWKGWNPLVFYYTDQYRFLKDCDWWPELDSIQQAIHSKKDYRYAETLYKMEQEDQVERGNLHAEDYASLYDHTYYRLYGKDWYGTLAATDKHIRTAKPKKLNERRRAACLPFTCRYLQYGISSFQVQSSRPSRWCGCRAAGRCARAGRWDRWWRSLSVG